MSIVLSDQNFSELVKIVHDLTGITISKNRNTMIEGRLRKRLLALKIDSYEQYLDLLKSDPQEKEIFINLVTTNETYFFRTPRIWDFIESKLLPEWTKKHPNKTFQAWSAAASSGEEAHSLGVILQSFKDKHPSLTYSILGTDISSEMLGLCKKGEYSGRSIEAFKKTRLSQFQKYMLKDERESFSVTPEIKKHLRFEKHNLFKSLKSTEKFDLILIRNVLIYFTPEDQQKVMELLGPRLAPEGILIIGESESLSHIRTSFQHKEPLIYHWKAEDRGESDSSGSRKQVA